MLGLREFAFVALPAFVGQNAAAADFDGDGNDDLLLRHLHSDAWRYYTFVDDVPVERDLGLESEPVRRFVATGDFDDDGRGDVLLRRHELRRGRRRRFRSCGMCAPASGSNT